LAVLLGYLLADPADSLTVAMVALVISVLSVPILMRWYHPLLILTWNAAFTPFFIPGQPYLWMILAFLGLGFAITNRFTSPDARFTWVSPISWSLIILLGVVALTAWVRGGTGLRILGSAHYGGKGYFYVVAAIFGYFALTSQRLPKQHAGLLVSLFFLSGLTALVPNLAYLIGHGAFYLFYLFPPLYAVEQASADYDVNATMGRIFGLTLASNALYCFLLARYGLRGIFDLKRPFRLFLFIVAAIGCVFCGFRSFMAMFLITVVVQFFFEGLYRTRTLLISLGTLTVAAAIVLPNVDRMPYVVQRTLSFLPVEVSPAVRENTHDSSEWRFAMWRDVLAQVPQYLLVGKGYSMDPTEVQFAFENAKHGYSPAYSWAVIAGAYHSGPLTLLVPFGVWGVAAFAWFVFVSLRYLYRHALYGDPALKTINLFILVYFVARALHYVLIFGMFSSDLFTFTGLIGLSVSLNGAEVPKPAESEVETEEPTAEQELVLAHERSFEARHGT